MANKKRKSSPMTGNPKKKLKKEENVAENAIDPGEGTSRGPATTAEEDVYLVYTGEYGKDTPRNYQLPLEMLAEIYQYLQLPDLINISRVCKRWREAATLEMVWRNITLDVHDQMDMRQVEDKIRNMPMLQNIRTQRPDMEYCWIKDEVLNHLFTYSKDLRKMNCVLQSGITPILIKKIVKRFPKLESVTLDLNRDDILQSLNILSRNVTLKEIIFYDSGVFMHKMNTQFPTVCKTIAKKFPSIKSLNIESLQHFLDVNTKSHLNAYVYMLDNISQRVIHLKLSVPLQEKILKQIKKFTKLEEFDLTIEWNMEEVKDETCLDLELYKLNNLKHLTFDLVNTIQEKEAYGRLLYTGFYNSVVKGTWKQLKSLTIGLHCGYTFQLGLIKKIIEYLPQLKKLKLMNVEVNVDDQLADIGTMSKLEELTMEMYPELTIKAINHIVKCKNLTLVELDSCSLMYPCSAEEMAFASHSLLSLVMELQNLKYLLLTDCGLSNMDCSMDEIFHDACMQRGIHVEAFD